MKTDNGVLSLVGGTPLVELRRLFAHRQFSVHAKLEGFNPAGSAKDRPAVEVIRQGIASGEIGPGTVVIESSSGNMGVGLAQVCRYHGLRFICVVDPRVAAANVRLMKAYGTEVDLVPDPDPRTGDFLRARLSRVQDLMRTFEDSYWPNQYHHRGNAESHFATTMPEIQAALEGVDYVFCATGTCGTLRGCGEYVQSHGLATKVVAVDAFGSVIFGLPPAKRLIPGMGSGIRPALCDPELAAAIVHVSDRDCVIGCRRLVHYEAILAGGSAGGVLSAIEKMADEIPENAICVAILPDRGERYLDTVYDDDWVSEHLGDLSACYHLDAALTQDLEAMECSEAIS